MNPTISEKNDFCTLPVSVLEHQVDKTPGDTHLLTQLYHAYRIAGRFNEASQILALLQLPDGR
ncbi:MAG: hypothetical protein R6V83_00570 [Candidatus Thorarchaeota archaeon]